MERQIRSQISDVYNRALGKTVDTKTLNFLVLSVSKGTNTIESITSTLVNTDEYKERIKGIYSILYYDHIGTNPTDKEFEEMWDSLSKDKLIENAQLDARIRASRPFHDKYVSIITSLMPNASQSDIDYYITKLQNPSYDFASLQKDIEAKLVATAVPTTPSTVTTITDKSPESMNTMEQPAPITIQVPPALDEAALTAFESAFGRHMFVKEYFKYVVYPPPEDKQRYFNNLAQLKDDYQRNFNTIANIYTKFCDTSLTEHQFVNNHLLDIDTPNYSDTVINNIINTDDYRAYMKATLQAYFKQLYDQHMDESDLTYIFEKIRQQKRHPKDEKIVETLKSFKQQTDEFIEQIFTVYKRVLERQPDMYEIEEQLARYRGAIRDTPIPDINSELAIKLATTLEFHDIIKKHIKIIYQNKHSSREISPSQLYATLQAIIRMTDTTIDNLDDRITAILDAR